MTTDSTAPFAAGLSSVVETRTAVVAGGTGLVGRALIQLLAESAAYRQVTTLVRRDVPVPQGIVSQRVDFEHLDELTLTDVDDAFCCLGTTRRAAGSAEAFRRVDLDYIVGFARLAKRAGARRFLLVSSVGASAGSPLLYSRTKGEGEAAISSLGFATVVILRPSFLVGERAERRPGEAMALAATRWLGPLLLGPLRRYAPVEVTTVARTMVRAAATAGSGGTVIESEHIR
jgi:uncharacterized protein YbjT (DUF2867 family)